MLKRENKINLLIPAFNNSYMMNIFVHHKEDLKTRGLDGQSMTFLLGVDLWETRRM
jgi:hypothetical protein